MLFGRRGVKNQIKKYFHSIAFNIFNIPSFTKKIHVSHENKFIKGYTIAKQDLLNLIKIIFFQVLHGWKLFLSLQNLEQVSLNGRARDALQRLVSSSLHNPLFPCNYFLF